MIEQEIFEADQIRMPPSSTQAEQSVIGGLMLNNNSWEKISDRIVENDFYRHDHRLIFRSIADLAEANKPLDIITLSEWMNQRGNLDDAGGLAYLATLAKDTPSAANIKAYADIVREKSTLRQLSSVGVAISDSIYNSGEQTSKELLDEAERNVFSIAERGNRQQSFHTIKDLLKSSLARIEELSKSDEKITGEASGYVELDEKTSGFHGGDLVIVAGRPAMGKTSFAMNIAEYVALHSKDKSKAVAVFSMEMPAEQLMMRLLASNALVPLSDIRNGNIKENDWWKVGKAVKNFSKTKLFIDDTPALSPIEIRAKTRRLARENGGVGLVVIDYLQLMQSGTKTGNRTEEISEISRSLKAIAKELGCPVIALSQLNRSLEQRPNKRPVMSDLRESGAIEQDADIIIFIYRDEVYNEDTPDKNIAEIIIGKQRNGPIGTVRLVFNGSITRFDNYSPNYQQ